jgi:hypothetical protein
MRVACQLLSMRPGYSGAIASSSRNTCLAIVYCSCVRLSSVSRTLSPFQSWSSLNSSSSRSFSLSSQPAKTISMAGHPPCPGKIQVSQHSSSFPPRFPRCLSSEASRLAGHDATASAAMRIWSGVNSIRFIILSLPVVLDRAPNDCLVNARRFT